MDEGIKRIFRRHFKMLSEKFERLNGRKLFMVSAAMDKLTELYSEICGISYNAAAAELHGGDDNDED